MPYINGFLDVVDVNKSTYARFLQEGMIRLFSDAAKEFLHAAIERVAVQTGMARGSFIKLAEYLGESVGFPANDVPGQRWYYHGGTRLPKTPESGSLLSAQDLPVTLVAYSKVLFTFFSDVFHYNLQEIGAGRPSIQIPPPWESFLAGKSAFDRFIRNNYKDYIPNIKEVLTKTRITVG